MAIVLSLLLALAVPAFAHEPEARPAGKVLGTIHFPTTTKSPAAQAAFVQGMLYLHLFEYPSAAREFQRAQALDPGFAMAYWGEAMSYAHPVWNQQDLAAGRAVLARLGPTPQARAAKAGDARERDFLASVEGLYGEGEKPARDLAWLAAMEAMAKRYPDDDEVQLFHALALLGADGGKRDLPRFLRAAQIAEAVYRRNPRHPGAAHYWIHGRDDPQHAAGALEAAQALSKIAPDAGHSQHMTSHIFVALGRWQDVVDANEAALRVVGDELAAKSQPPYRCGHYAEWLQYAWLQQGRESDAHALLADCERTGAAAVAWLRAHPGTDYLAAKTADQLQESFAGSLEHLQAMALVDSPAQRGALLARAPGDQAGAALWLARGLAALDAGGTAPARAALARLQPAAEGEDGGPFLRIMAGMLEGAILAREGDTALALERLRAAATQFDAQPVDYGPPRTVKPPRELLAEVLLAAGRKDEARAEFARALAGAPQRRAALAGLAAAGAAPAAH
jgi:tetratricopeptide (TPR) repeat protein